MEATSLEHICKSAGFTRGAFYSNFASKDSLLAALAEDEYSGLIGRLRATVEGWATRAPIGEGGAGADGGAESAAPGSGDPSMEALLFEALDAIGVNRDLYLLHSELLMRSIRDPEWAARFLDINLEFVDELGRVLQWILEASGRELVRPLQALTHSVVGIVMRASGVAAWRESSAAASRGTAGAHSNASSPQSGAGPSRPSARESAGCEILEVVLQVLYASSRPKPRS